MMKAISYWGTDANTGVGMTVMLLAGQYAMRCLYPSRDMSVWDKDVHF